MSNSSSYSSSVEANEIKSHHVSLWVAIFAVLVVCYYAFFIYLAIFAANKVKEEEDKVGDVLCTMYVNITCLGTEWCVERHMMWYKINDKLYRKVLHETTCLLGSCPINVPKKAVCHYFIDTPSVPYVNSEPETTKKNRNNRLFIAALFIIIVPTLSGIITVVIMGFMWKGSQSEGL